jgi:N4-gp56 family major capsid protein
MTDIDMGVTETGATGQDLVTAIVQQQLTANNIFMATIRDESARAVKGAKSVSFPRTGDLDPVAKVENVPTASQALTFAADSLALNQHFQTLVRLEDIADVQSIVDVPGEILTRSAVGMAKKFDVAIYNALVAGASASSPDNIIAHYASSAAITRTKILAARKLLNDQNVPMSDRFMAISTDQEAQLLDIDQFVSAEKYGDQTPLLNGELGRLFGFRIIMSTTVADNVTLYYHKSALAFARQIDPKWEMARAPLELLADAYSLSSLFGVKVLDSGKRVVLANATGS